MCFSLFWRKKIHFRINFLKRILFQNCRNLYYFTDDLICLRVAKVQDVSFYKTLDIYLCSAIDLVVGALQCVLMHQCLLWINDAIPTVKSACFCPESHLYSSSLKSTEGPCTVHTNHAFYKYRHWFLKALKTIWNHAFQNESCA